MTGRDREPTEEEIQAELKRQEIWDKARRNVKGKEKRRKQRKANRKRRR